MFHVCLRPTASNLPESPNREVGDISRSPTGRQPTRVLGIPQPEGWGYFTLAYRPAADARFWNLSTGRLGIVHFSLQRDPSPRPSP